MVCAASRKGRTTRSTLPLRPIQTPTTSPSTSTTTVATSVAARVTIASDHTPVATRSARQTAAATAARIEPTMPPSATSTMATSHQGDWVSRVWRGLSTAPVTTSLRTPVAEPRCSCTQLEAASAPRRIGDPRGGRGGVKGPADVQGGEGLDHGLAEAGGVDEGGDRDHRQRRHDGLVDADDDGPLGHGQLYLAEQLGARGPDGLRGLERVVRHRPDAVRRKADHRGYRVDHRGDRGGRRTDEEHEGQRCEIDERRHGLHEVEQRGEQPFDPARQPGPDAERD